MQVRSRKGTGTSNSECDDGDAATCISCSHEASGAAHDFDGSEDRYENKFHLRKTTAPVHSENNRSGVGGSVSIEFFQ